MILGGVGGTSNKRLTHRQPGGLKEESAAGTFLVLWNKEVGSMSSFWNVRPVCLVLLAYDAIQKVGSRLMATCALMRT